MWQYLMSTCRRFGPRHRSFLAIELRSKVLTAPSSECWCHQDSFSVHQRMDIVSLYLRFRFKIFWVIRYCIDRIGRHLVHFSWEFPCTCKHVREHAVDFKLWYSCMLFECTQYFVRDRTIIRKARIPWGPFAPCMYACTLQYVDTYRCAYIDIYIHIYTYMYTYRFLQIPAKLFDQISTPQRVNRKCFQFHPYSWIAPKPSA